MQKAYTAYACIVRRSLSILWMIRNCARRCRPATSQFTCTNCFELISQLRKFAMQQMHSVSASNLCMSSMLNSNKIGTAIGEHTKVQILADDKSQNLEIARCRHIAMRTNFGMKKKCRIVGWSYLQKWNIMTSMAVLDLYARLSCDFEWMNHEQTTWF